MSRHSKGSGMRRTPALIAPVAAALLAGPAGAAAAVPKSGVWYGYTDRAAIAIRLTKPQTVPASARRGDVNVRNGRIRVGTKAPGIVGININESGRTAIVGCTNIGRGGRRPIGYVRRDGRFSIRSSGFTFAGRIVGDTMTGTVAPKPSCGRAAFRANHGLPATPAVGTWSGTLADGTPLTLSVQFPGDVLVVAIDTPVLVACGPAGALTPVALHLQGILSRPLDFSGESTGFTGATATGHFTSPTTAQGTLTVSPSPMCGGAEQTWVAARA